MDSNLWSRENGELQKNRKNEKREEEQGTELQKNRKNEKREEQGTDLKNLRSVPS